MDPFPPAASSIAVRQMDSRGLTLLIAQHRMYDRAKAWALVHDIGIAVVAVAAPLVAGFLPDAAVVAGALAGGWVFLARTLFHALDRRESARAAVVQDEFDRYVFGMPPAPPRGPRVQPEDIARQIDRQRSLPEQAGRMDLLNWYTVDSVLDGGAAIAIAQRSNAAYSARLLTLNSLILLLLTVGWLVAAIAVGLIAGFSLQSFLLGMALPLLPVVLGSWDQYQLVRRAGSDRDAMAAQIGDVLAQPDAGTVLPARLLTWQDQLFAFRRDSPQVPNLIYRRTREANERAMSEAAAQLAATFRAQNP